MVADMMRVVRGLDPHRVSDGAAVPSGPEARRAGDDRRRRRDRLPASRCRPATLAASRWRPAPAQPRRPHGDPSRRCPRARGVPGARPGGAFGAP